MSLRIAAASDTHCRITSCGELAKAFAPAVDLADVLVLCGDLTDYGTCEEARVLGKDLETLGLPVVAVLGNHDHENGKPEEVTRILREHGVHVLDGDAWEHRGVGFAGTKGYIGGFGKRMLQAWGEEGIKRIVQEAKEEKHKLDGALASLRTEHNVVITHYAPVPDTLKGESAEILPFLGSSRLEEAIVEYKVDVVFHGHAHGGSLEGRLQNGVPVYNVAIPVLRRRFPTHPPFFLFDIAADVRREAGTAIAV